MPKSRFASARDLYAAFPTAAADVGTSASDDPCSRYLQALMQARMWNAAVTFCAYLLPKRDAIWWGCQSLRQMPSQLTPAESAALAAAEGWVQKPDETARRAALDMGLQGDAGLAAIWMMLAVGWSGGSIGPPEFPGLRAPPEQTARAVRTGLFIAIARLPGDDMPAVVKPWIENGERMVLSG